MPTDVRMRKIRYAQSDDKPVRIEYETRRGADFVKSELESESDPEPEFIEALRGFKTEFLRLLQLPAKYGEDIEIRQVSISYPRDVRGIVITGIKKLRETNGTFNMSTPHLSEPGETGVGGGMSSAMIEMLNELEQHAEHFLAGHRAQQELPLETKPKLHQGDIEDAITIDQAVRAEVLRALDSVLPPIESLDGAASLSGVWSEAAIAGLLLRTFEEVEFRQEGSAHAWAGIFKHTEEGGAVVWCGVRTDNDIPAFWYGIEPAVFETHPWATAPSLKGAAVAAAVRELRGLEAPADAVAHLTKDAAPTGFFASNGGAPDGETPSEFKKRTFRAAEAGNNASVLAQALHTTVTEWADGIDGWRTAAREGASDADLVSMLSTALQVRGKGKHTFGWSETAGVNGDSSIEYVEVTVIVELPRFTIGKGKRRIIADPEKLVAVLRSVFDIPLPTVSADAGEVPAPA